jgi:molybdate transport system substrate-binding protein
LLTKIASFLFAAIFLCGCSNNEPKAPDSKPIATVSESDPGNAPSKSAVSAQRAPRSTKPADDAPQANGQLHVAAASDLKFALDEVRGAFERLHPGSKVTVTYGSSGSFFAQLANEAPFDLFLSADIDYARRLVEQGQAVANSEFAYARGHIVIWVLNDSPLGVEQRGFEALRDEGVQKIAIANPKTAPYGRAAVAALKSLNVYDAVEPKLVYGDSVAQAAQMVESGAADVGIIALSLAVSPAMREQGKYWLVPENTYPPLVQGGVILRWAQDASLAGEFRDFLLSGAGTSILKQFGFDEP